VRSTPAVATPTGCMPPSCTITGLANGTSYQFSVRAVNEHGPGAWSVWSDAVIPYGTPGTPSPSIQQVDPWAPNAVIRASWAGVSANGGTVSYRWRLDGSSTWNDVTGTTTGDITVQGGSHTIEVIAVNSGGKQSAPGSASTSIQTQAVPPTPSGLSANVTDNQAPGSITWNWNGVSASPGGTANLRYEVSTNGGGSWASVGTATSYTRTGLAAGTYSLQVRAVNKAGASGASGAAGGTINQPPPTSWTVVPTMNTCPETATSFGRFDPGPPVSCASPGFIQSGDDLVVNCWRERPGASYTLWFRIIGGSDKTTYNSGSFEVAAGTTNTPNVPSGMPHC